MPLIAQRALNEIEDAVPGGLSVDVDPLELIARAGEWFCGIHRWGFLVGNIAFLNLRGAISLTSASIASDGKTVTSPGAFADYAFLEGDIIELVSGTDGTGTLVPGRYEIESKANDNALILKSDVSGGGTVTNVVAELRNDAVALPGDFDEPLENGIRYSDTIFNGFEFTSLAQINTLRAVNTEVDGPWTYYGAIGSEGSARDDIRLEIHPKSTNNISGAFRIAYRARIPRPTTGEDILEVPGFAEQAFLATVRAFAKGYADEEEGMLLLDRMLRGLVNVTDTGARRPGPLFAAAMSRDGARHGPPGTLRNGAARPFQRRRSGYGLLRTKVAAPG